MTSFFLKFLFILLTFNYGYCQTIKIGSQIWASQNLNVDRFRNGDTIPEARTAEEWCTAWKNKQPAWCYVDNDSINCSKYGKLYNIFAVNDPRSLAPKSFHIPSLYEWNILIEFLGGKESAGSMKSNNGWIENGNGNNSSGFSAFPAGNRNFFGKFVNFGKRCYYWSSTVVLSDYSWHFSVHYDNNTIDSHYDNLNGFFVRCIKD
jgi:uncharacterized protein (TIGR02145 family)